MEDNRAARNSYRLLYDDGLVDSSPLSRPRPYIASKMLKEQNDFQPARLAEKVLASSQPVMARNSRQSPSGGDADIVAEDIVIRHQNRAVDLLGRPGVRLAFGRDAGMPAADTVVQYGADVKMWSGNPKRPGLDRPGH